MTQEHKNTRTQEPYNFIFLIVLFTLTIFNSCSKDSSYELNAYANESIVTRAIDYGEFACKTIDNEWGIMCAQQINGKCKKAHGCIAIGKIGGGVLNKIFTEEQMKNFDRVDYSKNYEFHKLMYEAGWFRHPDSLGIAW